MILAAGLGKRMRPLTEKIPKPLVPVGGKPLLQYCLDGLDIAGIKRAVVNVHYLPDQIIDYLDQLDSKIDIQISDERNELLDSGGGIIKALPLLGSEPFLLLNADTFWIDDEPSKQDNISDLMQTFNPNAMDILLMIVPIGRTTGHSGKGDFDVDDAGRLSRYHAEGADAMIYAGVAIINPQIFSGISDKKFSLNYCFDKAIAEGRLFGHVMHGHWITVGTVDAIKDAETVIRKPIGA